MLTALSFAAALVVGLLVTPVIRHFATVRGLLDMPGPRKVHENPVPRLGGLAMAVAFAVGISVTLLAPDELNIVGGLRPNRAPAILICVALLLVVGLTAAVVAVVATAQFRSALEVRRTTRLVFADQALAYHLGAEDWASHLLRRDAEQDTVDDLTEAWAQQGVVLPIEGGRMVGAIEDLQGRFNLNDLLKADGTVDEVRLQQLRRLLDAVGVAEVDRIAAAIVDWIDPDQDPRAPLGAEDSSYLRREPAHRTADAPLRWVGELRLVDGVDAEAYALIAPHVAALPRGTPINVNTATLPVLQSLSESARGAPLDDVVARQRSAPFGSVPEFSAAFPHGVPNGIALDVQTAHFGLATTVVLEGATSTMYSVLVREPSHATRPIRRTTDPTP